MLSGSQGQARRAGFTFGYAQLVDDLFYQSAFERINRKFKTFEGHRSFDHGKPK